MSIQPIVKPSLSTVLRVSVLLSVCILLGAIMHVSTAYAKVTQLTTNVDRNTILVDESIQLTLTAQGSADRDAVNFRPLQVDFNVSQPSFSQSTQIINGSMSRTVTWTINLYPKQIGSFTVPRFTVDNESSIEFTVNVLPVDSASSSQPREFFVTSSIDTQSVYLQQQILYTVKIHLARDIQRGQLTQPNLAGAIIEQIGEDTDYQEIIEGVRYRIIERKYAIIPQASGNYVIDGPIFEAEVPTNSRRSFANFGRTKTISRRAPDININVQPIPDNYSETWLPSELVEITQQWQGETQPFVVGEPVTRTITLTALGLTKEQLPGIDLPYHPSFKVYPEQPSLASVERNDKLIAQGTFNSAIIPEEAGNFILPEVRIPWFNVNTGTTEFATLPASSIEVVAKPNNGAATAQTAPLKGQQQTTSPNMSPALPTLPPQSSTMNWLHYLLIATNVFTLIALYIFWLMAKTKRHSPKTAQTNIAPSVLPEQEGFTRLKQSLEQGHTHGISDALESWLQALYPTQFYSISASLAMHPRSGALETYNQLLANSFSTHPEPIDNRNFIERLTQFRKLATLGNEETARSVLYPK